MTPLTDLAVGSDTMKRKTNIAPSDKENLFEDNTVTQDNVEPNYSLSLHVANVVHLMPDSAATINEALVNTQKIPQLIKPETPPLQEKEKSPLRSN